MKYQRLVLRYEDRVSGSSFSNPTFRVNLNIPYDRPVGVYLEGTFINADINASANQYYVRVSLKNSSAVNSIVSKNEGFINDGVLGRVTISGITSTKFNRYNMNSQYNDNIGNLLMFPNQLFKMGILEFELTYGDSSTGIILASTGTTPAEPFLDNYCIVLGIYCDDEDKYN